MAAGGNKKYEKMKTKTTRTAFITGCTGQDGALLSQFLLHKGYTVHGLKRRSSSINTQRIDHLYESPQEANRRFFLHYGDMTDATNLLRLLKDIQPDEVYNLAAQSHVHVSFETPEYTANADALGPLRLLEAVRILGLNTRVYQASTSELYGNSGPCPQNETTPFAPCSPYATAKLYAYWTTINYREAYGLYASNGILFNHESPLRAETFVTRKITRAVAMIHQGLAECLHLGNLEAKRDWGHAQDAIEGMWQILQQPEPGDYVLATGVSHTVREFVELAFEHVGVTLRWEGEGLQEIGVEARTGQVRVRIDPRYFRPNEVHHLCGDASKARRLLGWQPRIGFRALVQEMVEADLKRLGGTLDLVGDNAGSIKQ